MAYIVDTNEIIILILGNIVIVEIFVQNILCLSLAFTLLERADSLALPKELSSPYGFGSIASSPLIVVGMAHMA